MRINAACLMSYSLLKLRCLPRLAFLLIWRCLACKKAFNLLLSMVYLLKECASFPFFIRQDLHVLQECRNCEHNILCTRTKVIYLSSNFIPSICIILLTLFPRQTGSRSFVAYIKRVKFINCFNCSVINPRYLTCSRSFYNLILD